MKREKDKYYSQDKTPQSQKVSPGKPHPKSDHIPKPKPITAPDIPSAEPSGPPLSVPHAESVPLAKPLGPETIGPEQPEISAERFQEQLLRLRADFDNFRKRTIRDKAELYEIANQDLILELLPVLDHFQLAIQAAIDHHAADTFQEGLQMIFDQLMGVLVQFGLTGFDAKKEPFDPSRFEAVNYLPSDTDPEGMVIAQTRRGYLLKHKLLRPAQVIVSSGPIQPMQNDQVNPAESTKE